MSDSKIIRKRKLQRIRKAGIFVSLLLSLWFGYQLADVRHQYYQGKIADLNETISTLNEANHELTQSFNQHSARLLLCENEKVASHDALLEEQASLETCEAEVNLYRHVVAPELTGNFLAVDRLRIEKIESEGNRYRLNFLLLQPKLQKAIINGDLNISVGYNNSDKVISVGELKYRFKYFQQASVDIVLPNESSPQYLLFTSNVKQYKRIRETLEQRIDWQ